MVVESRMIEKLPEEQWGTVVHIQVQRVVAAVASTALRLRNWRRVRLRERRTAGASCAVFTDDALPAAVGACLVAKAGRKKVSALA